MSVLALKLMWVIPGAGAIATGLNAAWALPVNTILLIALTLVTWFVGKTHNGKVEEVKAAVKDVQDGTHIIAEIANSAVNASTSAASAAADAARIAKEIGGAMRHVDPPEPSATVTTVPTETVT